MSQAFLPITPVHHAERCGRDRKAFTKGLQEQNIGNRPPLYRYPFAHVLSSHVPEHLPADTEWSSARQCSNPLFPDMITNDVNHMVDAIENVMDRAQ